MIGIAVAPVLGEENGVMVISLLEKSTRSKKTDKLIVLVKSPVNLVDQNLRCVFCHDALRAGALHVGNCSHCWVCFHSECYEGSKQCPTLGCQEKLDGAWHSSVKSATPRRRITLSGVTHGVQYLLAAVLSMILATAVNLFITTSLFILLVFLSMFQAAGSGILNDIVGFCLALSWLFLFIQFPFSWTYILSKFIKILSRHVE
jgi:hypothetical protein